MRKSEVEKVHKKIQPEKERKLFLECERFFSVSSIGAAFDFVSTLVAPFLCVNCTRFIIVSWTCSIIKIVSTLESELLALKLLQVEVGSRIVLPTHATPSVHIVLHWNDKWMSASHYACFSLGEYSNSGCCCIPCFPIHSSAVSGLAMMMPMTRYVSASCKM